MEVPEFFDGHGYFGASEFSTDDVQKPSDHFAIDELLDFSNNDDDERTAMIFSESFFENNIVVESCNFSFSAADQQFSGDLCVPCDEMAELEWLSNFVEDSNNSPHYSLHFLSTLVKPEEINSSSSETPPPLTSFQGKARSKRSRAAPGDWTTRLINADVAATKTKNKKKKKRREDSSSPSSSSCSSSSSSLSLSCLVSRKCFHCLAEKTPQWRTGPMGPKTLCNACGVRYKSGRLVPEYRPTASPSFVSTNHSNSHRKVLELRRQKELCDQNSIFGRSRSDGIGGGGDFLIHQYNFPNLI